MAKPTPLSGFPELLPEQRVVETQVVDRLRRVFELHGFANIETRAVEPLDQLLRKGETSKEVYVLRRLQADDQQGDAGMGLHFDLTVPFAVSVSPGQTCRTKRTPKESSTPSPSQSVSSRPVRPMVSMPWAKTDG